MATGQVGLLAERQVGSLEVEQVRSLVSGQTKLIPAGQVRSLAGKVISLPAVQLRWAASVVDQVRPDH